MTQYHLGDLLSITDGHLVSPDRMSGVYRIVNGVTGEDHATVDLVMGADRIKPWLLDLHPWLAEVQVPDFGEPGGVPLWLERAVAQYGEYHEVPPMPSRPLTTDD
jgi:hypothetical protein